MVGKSVGHSSTSLIDGVCFQNRNPARLPQKDKPEWQYDIPERQVPESDCMG